MRGPGLVEAGPEIEDVVATWPDALALTGATSREAAGRLPSERVVHLCCHGRVRTDSPQFSSLDLTGGPFTVLDLEGIGRSPSLIVLSACDLGSVDVKAGDDLLGLPAAIFARGVRLLVAALVPVEDRATRMLMVAMHSALVDGATAAGALRLARSAVWDVNVAHSAPPASFTCFGAG